MAGWIKFPRFLARCDKLTPSEKAVLLAILSYCNPIRDRAFTTWVGNEKLTEATGIKRRQLQYILAHLEQLDVIAVDTTPRSRTITVKEKWDGIRTEETESFLESAGLPH